MIAVSEPIVFVSTDGIKEGKLEAFEEQYREGAALVETEKPDTVAFLAYTDVDGTEVTTVHVFLDAAAMERHLEGIDERSERAAEFLEFREFEIYGSPSDGVMRVMERAAEGGATLIVRPRFVSGYLRPASPRTTA